MYKPYGENYQQLLIGVGRSSKASRAGVINSSIAYIPHFVEEDEGKVVCLPPRFMHKLRARHGSNPISMV